MYRSARKPKDEKTLEKYFLEERKRKADIRKDLLDQIQERKLADSTEKQRERELENYLNRKAEYESINYMNEEQRKKQRIMDEFKAYDKQEKELRRKNNVN